MKGRLILFTILGALVLTTAAFAAGRVHIRGTNGPDNITGTPGNDRINDSRVSFVRLRVSSSW